MNACEWCLYCFKWTNLLELQNPNRIWLVEAAHETTKDTDNFRHGRRRSTTPIHSWNEVPIDKKVAGVFAVFFQSANKYILCSGAKVPNVGLSTLKQYKHHSPKHHWRVNCLNVTALSLVALPKSMRNILRSAFNI
jgi:hypothetical protein